MRNGSTLAAALPRTPSRRRRAAETERVALIEGSVFRVVASGHPLLAACASARELVLIRSIDETMDYAHITVQGSEGRVRATAALPLNALANSSLVLERRVGLDAVDFSE